MLSLLKRLIRRTDAQDLIEYALIAALISCVAIGAMGTLDAKVGAIYEQIQAALLPAAEGSRRGTGAGSGTGGGAPEAARPPAPVETTPVEAVISATEMALTTPAEKAKQR
jgi:Flp pilus assembly pilin Flp